jgi:ABC-type Fe3+-hydroxamate transport system substrate-binding protein
MRRLLLASLLAVACRPAADRPATRPLASPAHRIVSLAPSSTELLFALGAGGQVVGRTTWCRYPPAALQVPDVGDGLSPNIEAIAARHPDLVVLYRSPLNETAAAQLRRLGIASITLAQDRLEDIAAAARELGRRTGRDAAGDSIAAALDALLGRAPPAAIARVAFVVWDNPPMVIGAGSYLDQLATLAGGTNVFHDVGAASATGWIETIVARNPDVILVLSDSTALPAYSHRPEWRAIRAVRDQRFIMLPADLFGRPSPTAPAAVAALRRALEGAARR